MCFYLFQGYPGVRGIYGEKGRKGEIVSLNWSFYTFVFKLVSSNSFKKKVFI